MELKLSTGWLVALVAFGLVALVGGIIELVYQLSTTGKLGLNDASGTAISNSPFSAVKVDYTSGKGAGLFAGAILALVGGFAVVSVLGTAYFMQRAAA